MRRHRFEPAKLVAGLVLLCGAAFALLDAADALRQPDWMPLAVVPPGLALAALVAAVGYAARRARRRAREARAAAARDGDADVSADVGADLRGLPMDELRETYDARFGARDAGGPGADGPGTGGASGDADRDGAGDGGRRGPGNRA
ncbi:hypothetical protein [Streptomyces sp. B8F3]|uniref:hypothetical protein n=1 Tax=unclassified Streptomyces TaxID=2593676 RepID=UPI00325CEE74